MTAPRADRSGEALRDAALTWHAVSQDPSASPESWQALADWLQADPAHPVAFSRVEDLHAELDDNADRILRLLPQESGTPGARPAVPKLWPWIAGAAFAAAVILVAFVPWAPSPNSLTQAAYEAPPGHVRTITLADGSHVDLSPGSRLTVRFDRLSRQLTLARGEAAFTVGHDARPLSLRAGDVQVRDIGTVFDVALRPSRVTVTVVSGLVAVSSSARPVAVTLAAGQQFIHAGGAVPDRVVATDAQAVLAWRTGLQTYRDVPLSDIVADLDRDFAAHIGVADAATGARRFSGVLKVDTMEATFNRLAALLDLSVVRHGDAVELAGPGAHP